MPQDFYFKMFAREYLTDSEIRSLPLEAQGLLIRMWCSCCLDGHLPPDLEDMAVAIGAKVSQMRTHMPLLVRFFCADGSGNLVSDRMERERVKRSIISKGASKAAKMRWDREREKAASPNADANADADSMQFIVHSTQLVPLPLGQGTGEVNPEVKSKPKGRGAKAEVIGDYPPELHAAFPVWRKVLEFLKSEDVREKFPAGKIFIPSSGVGTKGAAWKAWQKRTAQTCKGQKVTNVDVLCAIELWAAHKIQIAMAGGEGIGAKALPAMINAEDFDDAIVRAVSTRLQAQEVPNAS